MAVSWFFRIEGETVKMMARMEGPGFVGDAQWQIAPNDEIAYPPGLTYDALKQAGGGQLIIADDETFEIVPAERGPDAGEDDGTDVSGVTDDDVKDLFHPDVLKT